jgi:hypothetical protein
MWSSLSFLTPFTLDAALQNHHVLSKYISGFHLTLSFHDIPKSSSTVGLIDNEYELLHVVYPGYFSPDYERSKISLLKVPLRASGPEPQLYTFTVTCNEGQGFAVASGADYVVWLGNNDEYGELSFVGGEFYY